MDSDGNWICLCEVTAGSETSLHGIPDSSQCTVGGECLVRLRIASVGKPSKFVCEGKESNWRRTQGSRRAVFKVEDLMHVEIILRRSPAKTVLKRAEWKTERIRLLRRQDRMDIKLLR